jgi:hypothetical protein
MLSFSPFETPDAPKLQSLPEITTDQSSVSIVTGTVNRILRTFTDIAYSAFARTRSSPPPPPQRLMFLSLRDEDVPYSCPISDKIRARLIDTPVPGLTIIPAWSHFTKNDIALVIIDHAPTPKLTFVHDMERVVLQLFGKDPPTSSLPTAVQVDEYATLADHATMNIPDLDLPTEEAWVEMLRAAQTNLSQNPTLAKYILRVRRDHAVSVALVRALIAGLGNPDLRSILRIEDMTGTSYEYLDAPSLKPATLGVANSADAAIMASPLRALGLVAGVEVIHDDTTMSNDASTDMRDINGISRKKRDCQKHACIVMRECTD